MRLFPPVNIAGHTLSTSLFVQPASRWVPDRSPGRDDRGGKGTLEVTKILRRTTPGPVLTGHTAPVCETFPKCPTRFYRREPEGSMGVSDKRL